MEAFKIAIWPCRCGKTMDEKIEGWMYLESNLERVFGVPQMFTKRTWHRRDLLIAKVTDDFLFSGTKEKIESYMKEPGNAFDVGKDNIGGNFKFNGCEVNTTNEYTEISMVEYTERITPITHSRSRKHEV